MLKGFIHYIELDQMTSKFPSSSTILKFIYITDGLKK